MKAKLCLNKIEILLENMRTQDTVERLQSYAALETIIKLLDEQSCSMRGMRINVFEEYRNKLVWHCQAICGLDEGIGYQEEQHFSGAQGEIDNMKSVHCFNI